MFDEIKVPTLQSAEELSAYQMHADNLRIPPLSQRRHK
jgi:hypothetical protein